MTKHPRHRLSKSVLLTYALWGARAELNGLSPYDDDDDVDEIEKDIAEIRRRIKLVDAAHARKEGDQK